MLLVAATAASGIIAALYPDTQVRGWSIGTAYSAFFLLLWALFLGPLKVLMDRANPVHSAVRRDVGIAAGTMAAVHTVIGLQVHMGGSMSRYFIPPAIPKLSDNIFVAANWIGLFSVSVLMSLVVISNNRSLRGLGLSTWKLLQRGAYPAAILALVHGIAYQLLERRSPPLIAILICASSVVVIVQIAGLRTKRRRSDIDATEVENR